MAWMSASSSRKPWRSFLAPEPALLQRGFVKPTAYITDDKRHLIFADTVENEEGMTPLYQLNDIREAINNRFKDKPIGVKIGVTYALMEIDKALM
jgi:hypothetical protein